MCLSSVYNTAGDERTLICEYVSNIRLEGENIILVDILGQEITVPGTLVSVDLTNGVVLLQAA